MKNKKILVLGHSGFIGSHLDTMMSKSVKWDLIGCSLPDVDLTDLEDANRLIPFLTPDCTLVLAAAAKRQFGDTLEAFRLNTEIIENVCRLVEKNPVKRIIYISSTAVYGEETENISISEATQVNPTSYYGINKYTSERLLKKVCADNGTTSLICLRPPLVYGPNDKGKTYGPSGFSAAALENTQLILWGDGTELREFIYVEDLCRIIEIVAESEFEGELNVVSGKQYNFADVVSILKQQFPELDVKSKARSKQKANNAFDASKICSLLPENFSFTLLKSGLKKTIRGFDKNV